MFKILYVETDMCAVFEIKMYKVILKYIQYVLLQNLYIKVIKYNSFQNT